MKVALKIPPPPPTCPESPLAQSRRGTWREMEFVFNPCPNLLSSPGLKISEVPVVEKKKM